MFIHVKRYKQKFLVDTGSSVSIIKPTIYDIHPKHSNLRAANGNKINCFGEKLLTLDLGLRREFTAVFQIADVTTSIIGADFLHEFGLTVDIRNGRITDSTTGLHAKATISWTDANVVTAVPAILKEFPQLTAPPNYHDKPKHNIFLVCLQTFARDQ